MYSQEICILAPSEGLLINSKKVVKKLAKNISVYKTNLDIVDVQVEELIKTGVKVFIGRLGTKKLIELNHDTTVVGIKNTISDYIDAINFAKSHSDSMVAFYVYDGIKEETDHIADIETMCDMTNLKYKIYRFEGTDEARSKVKESIIDGAELGVGGAVTLNYAKENNLPYFVVENTEKAIEESIKSAEELLRVTKREEALREEIELRYEGYQAVVDLSNDAIISIDMNGNIDFVNTIAESVLKKTTRELIGRNIKTEIPDTKMLEVLKEGKPKAEEVISIQDTQALSNIVPLVVNGVTKGAVAKFQDIKIVQKNEHNLRIKLSKKGLIAKYKLEDIVGESSEIKATIDIAKGYAKTNSTILINGETGTGKELFAQGIHNAGSRKNAQFVAINCAVLDKNLLESELFGYVEGAFTGAVKGGKIGLFELAHNGTIFLDEIGEIPLDLQAKLLRVLQEKEIRRIGSTDVIPVNVRVISSTNRDLREEVNNNTFRSDLYYRLNVLNLKVPPLRQRHSDYKIIALKYYGKNAMNNEFEKILNLMDDYNWPGNVRELINFIERVEVLLNIYDDNTVIRNIIEEMYKEDIIESTPKQFHMDTGLEDYERARIISAIIGSKGSVGDAADKLGMSRSTLWRKRKKYGI